MSAPFQICGGAAAFDEDDIDHFDHLPDSILLVIFNSIGDVKALGRCCLVSRRFHRLVHFVDNIIVRVDCVISDDPASVSAAVAAADKTRGVFSHLARLVIGGIVKPIQALGQILNKRHQDSSSSSSSSSASADVSHHSPTEVLKNFKEIRKLKIELPAGELGVDDGVLLKWKANFGSTLDSCVILGASSSSSSSSSKLQSPSCSDCNSSSSSSGLCNNGAVDDSGSIPESFYTNGSLKLRVVWTISSLIAASARHYLLQPIVNDHETLESLNLTDADGQGLLAMGARQLKELRVKPVSASGSSQRTLVPALSMKLWYAPHLEIPGGIVLKGATLVAIRPSEEREGGDWGTNGGVVGEDGGCWISDAFEEPYRSAVRMLVKRRTYSLEMNSF